MDLGCCSCVSVMIRKRLLLFLPRQELGLGGAEQGDGCLVLENFEENFGDAFRLQGCCPLKDCL
jgi:hypothetical protein